MQRVDQRKALLVLLAGWLITRLVIFVTVTQTGSTLFSLAALPRFFCGWIAGSFTLV
jgi:hypothetical protein